MLKKKITFQISHLKSLVESTSSCVSVVPNFEGVLSLLPFHLAYLKHAVRELLDNKVSKYDPELNGIILGHSNIKVVNYLQHSDNFRIHLNYVTDVYLFTPCVGKNLSGIINKKSKEHIGCLIHSAFNASIPKPIDMGQELKTWLKIHDSEIGDEVEFTVSKVDFSSRIPYISGVIVSPIPGIKEEEVDSGFSCHDYVEESSLKKKKKKKKSIESSELKCVDDELNEPSYYNPEDISQLLNSDSSTKPSKSPSKLKRKKSELDINSYESELLTPPPSKKIKKEKRSLELEELEDVQQDNLLQVRTDKIKKKKSSLLDPLKIESVSPIIKKEPSMDELTSSLLQDAMNSRFSPASTKKRSKKTVVESPPVTDNNLNSTKSPEIGKSLKKRKSSLISSYFKASNSGSDQSECKHSESPMMSDDGLKKRKKRKSKRNEDMDKLRESLLADTISNLV